MSVNSSFSLSSKSSNQIIIWARYFYPGFRAGGPILSLSNLCNLFSEKCDFCVVTQARDSGDPSMFPNIIPDLVNYTSIAPTIYIASLTGLFRTFALILRSRKSIFYLNSIFSLPFSILPLLLYKIQLLPVRRVVLCPRGELFASALQSSFLRKKVYLQVAQSFNLYQNVHWHATSDQEAELIHKIFKPAPRFISIISNIPSSIPPSLTICEGKLAFRANSSRLVFASRVLPHKNLLIVLEALKVISSPIVLDIYGPIEDKNYYQRCLTESNGLPSNISVAFNGAFLPQNIKTIFTQATVLVHPSLSENYCHTIVQALAYYTPTLIGTNTPWSNHSCDAITTCDPLDPRQWSDSIRKIISLSQYEYLSICYKARSLYESHISSLSYLKRDYLSMLLSDN